MLVSALSYGNWITHGSQIEEEAARACVNAALDAGITTFDTADVYALGQAETVLGRALKGVARDSIEIFTKVYWPTGPNPNDRGLSRKHIMESLHASLERLQTDHVDLLQAHRFDYEAPLEETLQAFDDLVRQGKVHYVGVSEWTATQIEDALRLADEMGFDRIVSNQPQYSLIWRVIEAEVVPLCQKEGVSQIVWSPLAQGILTGKYLPAATPPEGTRATGPEGGGDRAGSCATRCSSPCRPTRPCAASRLHPGLAWPWPGCCRTRTSAAPSSGPAGPSRSPRTCKALEVDLEPDFVEALEKALDRRRSSTPASPSGPPSRADM